MKRSLLLAFGLLLCSCGGSHSHDDTSFEGTWDTNFKLIRSEDVTACNWIANDYITGFTDTEEISSEDGINYEIYSGNEFLNGTGDIDESGTLHSTTSYSGDVYDDGTYCYVTFSLSFAPVRKGKSDTQFYQVVNCNDGFSCEERAVGVAQKRVE